MPSRPAMLRGMLTWEAHDDGCAPPGDHPAHPIERPPPGVPPSALPPAQQPLIQPADLRYQGCFRLPPYPTRFDYPPRGMAFSAAHESLWVPGFADYHQVSEVSIPPLVTGAASLHELHTAATMQPLADPTEGSWYGLAYDAAINLGGFLVYDERLIVDAYRHYDADGSQPSSHWSRPLDLSETGRYVGPVPLLVTDAVGGGGPHAGFVSAYMGHVPAEWQTRLGGPAFTGNSGIPIVSRTSLGPAVFTFDPADIGVKTPVPTTPLVYYPGDHATLGPYTPGPTDPNPNLLFNGTMQVCGVLQPVGWRSVLMFGVIGIGVYAYGQGTADPSLHGQPVPGTNGEVFYCYDPVNLAKGDHAYPYDARVWAYDAEELALVVAGSKQPWEIVPYAAWTLPSDFYSWLPRIAGACDDPARQRIYVSQTRGDGDAPLIHCYAYDRTRHGRVQDRDPRAR
jgi:hypothetical protein